MRRSAGRRPRATTSPPQEPPAGAAGAPPPPSRRRPAAAAVPPPCRRRRHPRRQAAGAAAQQGRRVAAGGNVSPSPGNAAGAGRAAGRARRRCPAAAALAAITAAAAIAAAGAARHATDLHVRGADVPYHSKSASCDDDTSPECAVATSTEKNRIPYADGCLSPTTGSHANVVQTTLLMTLDKTQSTAIPPSATCPYLAGTDLASPAPTWSVGELPSWLPSTLGRVDPPARSRAAASRPTGNSTSRCTRRRRPRRRPSRTPRPRHRRRRAGRRHDHGARDGLRPGGARRLRLRLGARHVARNGADPAEGVAYSNSVYKRGETVLLGLGGEIYIPFQSCDVDRSR